jgi:hypothetical protein
MHKLFIYGPQAPTVLCSGPMCAEMQGEWIVNVMKFMREKKLKVIDAAEESEQTWVEEVKAIANASLLPTTRSVRLELCDKCKGAKSLILQRSGTWETAFRARRENQIYTLVVCQHIIRSFMHLQPMHTRSLRLDD